MIQPSSGMLSTFKIRRAQFKKIQCVPRQCLYSSCICYFGNTCKKEERCICYFDVFVISERECINGTTMHLRVYRGVEAVVYNRSGCTECKNVNKINQYLG